MIRTHIELFGYFDLEYLCEFEGFDYPEFFNLLNRLKNDEIDNDEYFDEMMKLENKVRSKFPDKFQIGGLVF